MVSGRILVRAFIFAHPDDWRKQGITAMNECAGAPIRWDKDQTEREAFERLKAQLASAYAAPEQDYRPLTAAEVIARNCR